MAQEFQAGAERANAATAHNDGAGASATSQVPTLRLRNIARYVKDVEASVALYAALGFRRVRDGGDLVVLAHTDWLQLVLHRWDERPTTMLDTAIGFTLAGDGADVRRYLEAAGWSLLRAPHEGDVGYFFIYGDLDGNPINIVGKPNRTAPPAGSVRLVLRNGQPVAENISEP